MGIVWYTLACIYIAGVILSVGFLWLMARQEREWMIKLTLLCLVWPGVVGRLIFEELLSHWRKRYRPIGPDWD